MNLRFAGMITGCMLVGASAAAYHRADSRPAPSGATLTAATAELPTPPFLEAATGAPTSAAWPPATSVAFYEEMFEQLPAATAPAAAPQVVAALPDTRQTLPAPNASAGVGIPQSPPVRSIQTRPVRTANVTASGAQTPPPPPSNTNVAASSGQTPPAVDPNAGAGGRTPQRARVAPPRDSAGMVEIVTRDRFGRPIRVERGDRRRVAGARAYPPPPPYRLYHSHPHGPHGAYGPYGLHR